jgi:ATPase subunit of ABC transporter with duplicated ATPase domains
MVGYQDRTDEAMHSPTQTRTTGPTDRPVGRDALLAEARAALHPDAGLLLTGPAGIGTSTLLRTLARETSAAGGPVLHCEPVPDEAALPHAALIDLFRTVPDRLTARLPERQYQALHSVLLRGGDPRTDLDRLTLRVAVAGALELIGQDAPVLLVLDGLQHLDRPSAPSLSASRVRTCDRTHTGAAAGGPSQEQGES